MSELRSSGCRAYAVMMCFVLPAAVACCCCLLLLKSPNAPISSSTIPVVTTWTALAPVPMVTTIAIARVVHLGFGKYCSHGDDDDVHDGEYNMIVVTMLMMMVIIIMMATVLFVSRQSFLSYYFLELWESAINYNYYYYYDC